MLTTLSRINLYTSRLIEKLYTFKTEITVKLGNAFFVLFNTKFSRYISYYGNKDRFNFLITPTTCFHIEKK
jgi:hypothetical protein